MMLKVTEKKSNFCEAIIVNNKQEGNFPPVCYFISLNLNYLSYLSCNAATPGSAIPSSISSEAPPPVEM